MFGFIIVALFVVSILLNILYFVLAIKAGSANGRGLVLALYSGYVLKEED